MPLIFEMKVRFISRGKPAGGDQGINVSRVRPKVGKTRACAVLKILEEFHHFAWSTNVAQPPRLSDAAVRIGAGTWQTSTG